MPIYEYECGACGEDHEVIQKFSDAPKRKCPFCGALKLRRKVSLSSFQLKGSGWYATDYAAAGKNGKSRDKTASSKDKPEKAGAGAPA
jgi:putative FmdB family regulatory protein